MTEFLFMLYMWESPVSVCPFQRRYIPLNVPVVECHRAYCSLRVIVHTAVSWQHKWFSSIVQPYLACRVGGVIGVMLESLLIRRLAAKAVQSRCQPIVCTWARISVDQWWRVSSISRLDLDSILQCCPGRAVHLRRRLGWYCILMSLNDVISS